MLHHPQLEAITHAFKAMDVAITARDEAIRAQRRALEQIALPPKHVYRYEIAPGDRSLPVGRESLEPIAPSAYGKIAIAKQIDTTRAHIPPDTAHNCWTLYPLRLTPQNNLANQFNPGILIALKADAITSGRFSIVPQRVARTLGVRLLDPRILQSPH